MIQLTDGSRVEMRATSEIALEPAEDGTRIRLNNGSVIVSAANQRSGHLYVQTRDCMVSVVGTVFLVTAEETGSRIAVIQGEVHVQQGETLKSLLPGEQWTTGTSLKALTVDEAISWSSEAPVHLARLKEFVPAPVPIPQEKAPEPSFEVVSIKPNPNPPPNPHVVSLRGMTSHGRVTMEEVTLRNLVQQAYDLQSDVLIEGQPRWFDVDRFDVLAKAENPDTPSEEIRAMLRSLLADRFTLVIHRETREISVYALVVGKGGVKMQEAKDDDRFSATGIPNGMVYQRTKISVLAYTLSNAAKAPVRDLTGLTAAYNFTLDWSEPEGVISPSEFPVRAITEPGERFARMVAAVETQLGLKLEKQKAPVEFLVVDRAEHPDQN